MQVLIMTGCPYAEEVADRFKAEALIALGTTLKKIKVLNEEEVADEDVVAATEERNERAKQKREAEEEAIRVAAEKAAEEAEKGKEPKSEEEE